MPQPYQRPPTGASLQERQKIYDDHKVAYSFWAGGYIGEKRPMWPSDQTGYFAKYFEASGDTVSASLAHKALASSQIGAISFLGTMAVAVTLANNGDFATVAGNNVFWLGVPAEALFSMWGTDHYFNKAKKSFNEYLKRDLGLPEEALSVSPKKPWPSDWSVGPEVGWLYPGARYVDQNDRLQSGISGIGWRNTSESYGQNALNIYEGVGAQRSCGWMRIGFGYRYFDFGNAFATATGTFGSGESIRAAVTERNEIQSLYFSFGGVHNLTQALKFSLGLETGLGWDDMQYYFSETGNNGENFDEYSNVNMGGEAFWGAFLATLEYKFSKHFSIALDGGFDYLEAGQFIVVSDTSNYQALKANTYVDFYGTNSEGSFNASGLVGSLRALWYL